MPTRSLLDNVRLPIAPSPLLGRDHERATLVTMLQQEGVRLVTLTGPGGVGKTHLSLEVATELGTAFAEGAVFVSLATIRNESQVLSTIASALGIRDDSHQSPLDRLVGALAHREMLLVLDNVEQVLGAAPDLGALIGACPGLTLLITSRSPLRLRAEREYPVAPLELPGHEEIHPKCLAGNAAVSLFVDRARSVRPEFTLTESSAAAVAELCRRLDGLPLALELAAAMTRVLPPQTLLARMTRRLPLLANGPTDLPDRHRALRNTIAWSYDLLSTEEKRLFRRLSVFVGGSTLPAIEALCAAAVPSPDDDFVLSTVASLVDKSLINRVPGSEDDPRFTMLATIQEYAAEQLAAEDDPATAWRAHLAWCLGLALAAEPELTGPRQAEWLDQIDRERDNFRAALSRSLDLDPGMGLQLATALWRYWSNRGSLPEGYDWLRRMLDRAPDAQEPAQARALGALGNLALDLGDYESAYDAYGRSLALWEQLGHQQGIANALNGLGLVDWYRGDNALARSRHQCSLRIRREVGDRHGEANSLNNLANVLKDEGETASARDLHHQALAIRAELGDRGGVAYSALNLGDLARRVNDPDDAHAWLTQSLDTFKGVGDALGVGYALHALGLVALQANQHRKASQHFADALTIRRHLGDRRGMIECLEGVAAVAATTSRPETAARLFGASLAHRERIAAPRPEAEQEFIGPYIEHLQAQLTPGQFDQECAAGDRLDLQSAVKLAMATASEIPPGSESSVAALSARELEVLRLVASGMTNGEAADQLFLSRRTIDAHLRRIYDKLRIESRQQLVAFAIRQGLA